MPCISTGTHQPTRKAEQTKSIFCARRFPNLSSQTQISSWGDFRMIMGLSSQREREERERERERRGDK
jgi:hypothetical protein